MADSDLALGYDEIYLEVADTLGYTRDSTKHSSERQDRIAVAIKKGYSDFLREYDWTFLTAYDNLTTTTPYSTGTITVTNDDATVTLATGTWPSWAAQGVLVYGGTEYEVASRTDNADIELADAFQGTTAAGESYELRRLAYDLPDDFGQPQSFMAYSGEYGRRELVRTSPAEISRLRTTYTDTSYPDRYAIRPKAFAGTATQTYELLLFPMSDTVYILRYQYKVVAMQDLDGTTSFHYGAQPHSQSIQDCCMAAAKYLYKNMSLAAYREDIALACQRSIERDKEQAPSSLGHNADHSDGRGFSGLRHLDDSSRYVTVDSVIPDL